MTELRIKGQEASIRISREGVPLETLTAIKDFTWSYMFSILSEGYVGETTMRKDDIYNGISGSFTVHQESQDLLIFLEFLKERAQRKRNPNTSRVNASVRLNFPNGEAPLSIIRDMKFGDAPNAIPSREGYVNTAFSYEAEDTKLITA